MPFQKQGRAIFRSAFFVRFSTAYSGYMNSGMRRILPLGIDAGKGGVAFGQKHAGGGAGQFVRMDDLCGGDLGAGGF